MNITFVYYCQVGTVSMEICVGYQLYHGITKIQYFGDVHFLCPRSDHA